MVAAEIHALNSAPQVERTQPLFSLGDAAQFDVSADGQRFLIEAPAESGVEPLTLVQNWTAALRK